MPLVKCRGSLVSIAFLLSGLGRRSPILVDSRLPFWRGPPYLSLIHDLLVSKGRNARVSLIPEQLFSVPGMRDFLEWSTLLGLLASSYGSLVNNLTLTTAFPTKD